MSSAHGETDTLEQFQQYIIRVVEELLADPDARWTITSIAAAGQISRNQLYAWMGRGPQKLKRLPSTDRVITFFQGVKRPWGGLFRILGWDVSPQSLQAPAPAAPDLESKIRRIEQVLDGPGLSDERRRELEIALVSARSMRDAASSIVDSAWSDLDERREA